MLARQIGTPVQHFVVIACFCALALSAFAVLKDPRQPPPLHEPTIDSSLTDRVSELEGSVSRLSRRIDELVRSDVPAKRSESAAAVEEPITSSAEKADSLSEESLSLFDDLIDGHLPLEDRLAALRALGKEGLLAEASQELRDLVALDPESADLQFLLGSSLASALRSGGVSAQEAAALAREARSSLSSALESDPEHWEARFTRAMLNAFAPGASGRQPEAIADLKRLAEAQDRVRPQPRDASTWYFLGNLYLQQQQKDKAKEAWSTGARLFPDDSRFGEKLQALAELNQPLPGQEE